MALHRHFIILSLPRSGSTYLVDYLDAAPSVKCLSEVFNPEVVLLRHHRPSDAALTDRIVRDSDRGPRAVDRIANYGDLRAILGRTRFARLVA